MRGEYKEGKKLCRREREKREGLKRVTHTTSKSSTLGWWLGSMGELKKEEGGRKPFEAGFWVFFPRTCYSPFDVAVAVAVERRMQLSGSLRLSKWKREEGHESAHSEDW